MNSEPDRLADLSPGAAQEAAPQAAREPAPDGRPPAGPRDGWWQYIVTVGVLMVLIIALLAALWARERAARLSAQRELAKALRQCRGMQSALGQIIAQNTAGRTQPIHRADLPTRTVRLDGVTRPLLLVGSAAGRRMGFAAGDMILITGSGPTRPGKAARPGKVRQGPATRPGKTPLGKARPGP